MAKDDRSITPEAGARDDDRVLVHTKDLSSFKIPKGDPDPRGWDVRSSDGQTLGKVNDLLVDRVSGRVRYLEVSVDKDVVKAGGREWALVPVGAARLDDDRDDVIVDLAAADLPGIPAYQRGALTRDYEQSLRSYVRERPRSGRAADVASRDRDSDFYAGPEYDDRSFFGSRRAGQRGVADRVADKLDDMKDRVDANPRSRPGPDATDRPGYGTSASASAPGTPGAPGVPGAVERGARGAANAVDDVKDRVDANPASRPGPDPTDRPGRR